CVQWPSEVPAGPLALEPASGAASPDVHHWGFPGFPVVLHPEDAEGLYLNLTSPQPCFWVMWREGESEDELPAPQIVTLSY
ncbi:DUF3305 domain-containing protein, partial [Gulbenkiania mobilis]